jgi:hypothetical protein
VSADHDPATELAATYAQQLRRTGEVRAHFDTDDERNLYRRAGRAAGRLLDRPIRTLVNGNQVFIVLDDWMDNPLQVQVEANRTRKAINQAFATDAAKPRPAIPKGQRDRVVSPLRPRPAAPDDTP